MHSLNSFIKQRFRPPPHVQNAAWTRQASCKKPQGRAVSGWIIRRERSRQLLDAKNIPIEALKIKMKGTRRVAGSSLSVIGAGIPLICEQMSAN